MISLQIIFLIICIHWFADFVMQDEKWALGKSKNWSDLLLHTITYSLMWILPLWYIGYANIFHFVFLTFLCHTITDYVTSRVVSYKFGKGEYGTSIPNSGGFTVIGYDQALHYLQLFTTYYYLLV